jgi:uncharacterized integral membrane protein
VPQHPGVATTPERAAPAKPPAKRQRARLVAASSLGALVTLFAVLNFGQVDVDWLFGTWSTPLIIVILLSFAAGMALDRALVRRSRGRRREPASRRREGAAPPGPRA